MLPQPFQDFLNYTLSQREVALVIAANDGEASEFEAELNAGGFGDAGDIFVLLECVKSVGKHYLILTPTNFKPAYDFAVQYPTGQVEIFNHQTMKPEVVSPEYQNSAVIFLITKDNLSAMQNRGLNILDKAGLTYQS